ncbi:unnamed protein product [Ranitomeya imitator]|uniref:Uncharacterized protein n=1 Tax=Ranitomeya imitator TaxID=111125 RepID=A0ABN9L617_9NEOB|nr:unnamed protein product [Ranitomeya imitator]
MWLNKEVRQAINSKKKAFALLKQDGTIEALKNYREKNTLSKKLIKAAKKETEKHIAKESKTNPKLFFNYINSKRIKTENVGPLKNSEERMVVDDEEKANILNTFFSTVFTVENEMLGEIPRNNENPILRVTNLTQEEVRNRLNKIKIDKSPGPDGLHPRVLRELTTGSVPQDWRIANVVPIFKKGSKSEPGNYRPDSIPHVEDLIKKQEEFEKMMAAQGEKFEMLKRKTKREQNLSKQPEFNEKEPKKPESFIRVPSLKRKPSADRRGFPQKLGSTRGLSSRPAAESVSATQQNTSDNVDGKSNTTKTEPKTSSVPNLLDLHIPPLENPITFPVSQPIGSSYQQPLSPVQSYQSYKVPITEEILSHSPLITLEDTKYQPKEKSLLNPTDSFTSHNFALSSEKTQSGVVEEKPTVGLGDKLPKVPVLFDLIPETTTITALIYPLLVIIW